MGQVTNIHTVCGLKSKQMNIEIKIKHTPSLFIGLQQ